MTLLNDSKKLARELLLSRGLMTADSDDSDTITLRAALKAMVDFRALSLSTQGTGWEPIETAPKDGRYIIAGRFKEQALAWVKHSRWITADEIADIEHGESDEFDPGWTDGNRDDEPCFPTHWQPLPSPPTEGMSDG